MYSLKKANPTRDSNPESQPLLRDVRRRAEPANKVSVLVKICIIYIKKTALLYFLRAIINSPLMPYMSRMVPLRFQISFRNILRYSVSILIVIILIASLFNYEGRKYSTSRKVPNCKKSILSLNIPNQHICCDEVFEEKTYNLDYLLCSAGYNVTNRYLTSKLSLIIPLVPVLFPLFFDFLYEVYLRLLFLINQSPSSLSTPSNTCINDTSDFGWIVKSSLKRLLFYFLIILYRTVSNLLSLPYSLLYSPL